MKLNNICEANNVLNKEEIQGFLDACNYDKKWTVNKSGEISLGGNFKLDSNLLINNNIKTLPLKIKKAKNSTCNNNKKNPTCKKTTIKKNTE